MELVIVIAVIAVLAAVLIPTFANIIQRANESNDISVARNMNTILATEQIGGEAPSNMEEVTYVLTQNGYKLENLTPTADGNIFVWDSATNRLIYVSGETGEVLYSENNAYASISDIPNTAYVTVHNVDEIKDWAERSGKDGISFYFAANIDVGTLEFTKPCSIDTGTYTLTGTVNYNLASYNESCEFNIEGNIENAVINAPTASVNNYSNATKITVNAVANNSYHEYGYVRTLEISTSGSTVSNVVIENTAMIDTVTLGASASASNVKVTNNGYIKNEVTGSDGILTNNGCVGDDGADSYVYEIDSYADLANFRDKVNAGNHFTGINISLNTDINLTGRAWVPIGYDSRDNYDNPNYIYFAGTFNGNNHTVRGLSNVGYVPTILREDTYSYGSNRVTENNYVYGFFGIAHGATITNLNVTNINIQEDSDYTLDSVGGIVGFIESGSTITGCTVSGKIYGTDAVAGIAGRLYYQIDSSVDSNNATLISDCSVNVTIVCDGEKTAGILGYTSTNAKLAPPILTISNCTISGSITSIRAAGNTWVAGVLCLASADSINVNINSCTVSAALALNNETGGKYIYRIVSDISTPNTPAYKGVKIDDAIVDGENNPAI